MAAAESIQSTSSTISSSFSNYFYKLEPNVKATYVEKISLCDGIDPYTMNKNSFSTDFRELPNLEFPDISNYLVVQTSFYTRQQMKAFKSLEAYNFFVCGWVHGTGIKKLKDGNRMARNDGHHQYSIPSMICISFN